MSSISTKTGDGGQTSLAGGTRVSKSSLRVESYGTVDELNSAMGFARSICNDNDERLPSKLSSFSRNFQGCAALATPPESRKENRR